MVTWLEIAHERSDANPPSLHPTDPTSLTLITLQEVLQAEAAPAPIPGTN